MHVCVRLALIATAPLLVLSGCRDAGNPPAEPQAQIEVVETQPVELSATKKAGLQTLHTQVIQQFIQQPRFGRGRMMVSYELDRDIVSHHGTPIDASANAHPGSQFVRSTSIYIPPRVRPPEPTPTSNTSNLVFKPTSLQSKVESQQLAHWLMYDPVEAWKFRTVELIGLSVHPLPVVYLTDDLPEPNRADALPTRTPNPSEQRGLDALRQRETVFVEKLSDNTVRMIAPIFAGKTCAKCHEKTGEMLGAFSYTFDVGVPLPLPVQPIPPVPLP